MLAYTGELSCICIRSLTCLWSINKICDERSFHYNFITVSFSPFKMHFHVFSPITAL